MTPIERKLAFLRQVEEAATKGPWKHDSCCVFEGTNGGRNEIGADSQLHRQMRKAIAALAEVPDV